MARFISAFRVILKFFEWLSTQLGWLAGALTIIMIIGVIREVIGRYFFNNPSGWSVELNGYLLIALVYISASYTELMEGHIRIDFLYSHFKGKVKHLADIIISFICICWVGILAWQGGDLALKSLVTGARSGDAMMWPLFPSQAMIPIGAFILFIILIGKLVKQISCLLKQE